MEWIDLQYQNIIHILMEITPPCKGRCMIKNRTGIEM